MVVNKRIGTLSIAALTLIVVSACGSGSDPINQSQYALPDQTALANELERSLFEFIVDPWYPRIIDTTYGGYISAFNHDWSISEGSMHSAGEMVPRILKASTINGSMDRLSQCMDCHNTTG